MIVGSGEFRYEFVPDWGRGPRGVESFGEAIAVAVDSQDRVYVASRRPEPRVLVFSPAGELLSTWGQDVFTVPGGLHSIWISDEDEVLCADALDHFVRRLTTEGELLQTLGTPGDPGTPGTPFNMPTKAVLSPSGDILVSDGYGQERVHRFSSSGQLLCSWGTKGSEHGEFDTPHGVWVDSDDRVWVADRANDRIQIFDADGRFLNQLGDLAWPNDVAVDSERNVYVAEAYCGISIFSAEGELLARWGEKGPAPHQFGDMPHGVAVDSHGDLYVAEVVEPDLFHKLERV